MSSIKDLMVGNLIDGPLFNLFSREGMREMIAQSLQSIAMGDQFQLNYIHSLLLVPSVVLSQTAVKVLLILERC